MSLKALVSAYLLGGLTFLPLLLITIAITAWFTLPHVQNEDGRSVKERAAEAGVDTEKDKLAHKDNFSSDGAANATFAVLRSYNFQSALSTLNARANAASQGNGEGHAEAPGQESMSVYQSMYRSVFDRSRTALNKNPLADTDEPVTGTQARGKPSAPVGSMFHIVVRHGHLMLYDSPAELEVRHVISMAHHSVSLTDGDGDDENMLEPDLFIKRTAIVLKPHASSASGDVTQGTHSQPKPFYLFSSNCSEKEDFYHALVAAQPKSPVPQPLDSASSIKLQSSIHSNSLTPETRALNALVNRIFLALHRTPFLEDLVRDKIEKKISRVAKPAFISYVSVQSIDLGDAGPILSNLRLKDIHISGDMILSMDVKYTGGIKVVIAAVAKLDLGQRFKVRTVDLVLAGSLQRLQGRMLVRVKPPPSNRLWFCFENMPDMEIKVEPIVSSRQITYNFILRQIENRIREVFGETLVKPNWDDVPFFDTHKQTYRGGIWQPDPEPTEEQGTGQAEPSEKDMLSARNEKTMSMPNLPNSGGGSATTSGAQTPVTVDQSGEHIQSLKHRSATALPSQSAQAAAEKATNISKGLRSPSFTTPLPSTPSVAIDGSNIDAVRGIESPPPAKRWIGRSTQPAAKRDAVDAVREVKDRSTRKDDNTAPRSPGMSASTAVAEGGDDDEPALLSIEPNELEAERRGSAGSKSSGSLHPNVSDTALPLPRTPSYESLPRTDTASSTQSSQTSQPRGKALFAATAAATSAARQWTLNAVANRKQGQPIFRPPSSHKPGPQEPVGRGQPLPPIGQPLPGPKTSLWGGSAFAGGSVKRKPVLPTRPPAAEQAQTDTSKDETNASIKSGTSTAAKRASDGTSAHSVEEDEFGPWRENFGEEHDDVAAKTRDLRTHDNDLIDFTAAVDQDASPTKKPPPPPLPARRKRAPELPARPHERQNKRFEESEIKSAESQLENPQGGSSTTPSQSPLEQQIPEAPAATTPLVDDGKIEREKTGSGGIEIVDTADAPAGKSKIGDRDENTSGQSASSKKVTLEETPDSGENDWHYYT